MPNSEPVLLGVVEELWRYPVKSMIGERLSETEGSHALCGKVDNIAPIGGFPVSAPELSSDSIPLFPKG